MNDRFWVRRGVPNLRTEKRRLEKASRQIELRIIRRSHDVRDATLGEIYLSQPSRSSFF